MNFLLDWLDNRTGFRHLMHEALYENVPSGARFRYITGSMLVFAFVTQAVTGIFLWTAYSPSSQTAYESVWWIQYQMIGGWLVRGIHHFMAQAMVIVMGLHLLQIVWDGAYRKPREINHWLGLVLMQLVMGLGLTGYLLPWDQKGYWATSVATNLATLSPVAGKETQLLAVGGSEYGHHTLTRFFALHAGILPALLVLFLALHIAAFRKHGITAHITPGRPDDAFWPKQVLYDAIGCLALLGSVLFAIWFFNGAELGAPADPSKQYSAARPEWYFLFLFQLLKYFPGSSEVIGAIVIPGVAMGVLFMMPFIGRSELGHRFNRLAICSLLLGAGVLTVLAVREDYFSILADKLGMDKSQRKQYAVEISKSQDFLAAKEHAEHESHRMNELINRRLTNPDGSLSEPLFIQKQGAVYLLRNDPLTQGPVLFAAKCASCHDYRPPQGEDHAHDTIVISQLEQEPKVGKNGKVIRDAAGKVEYGPVPNGAPNLYGFGTRDWIAGLLDPKRIAQVEIGEPVKSKNPATMDEDDSPDNHARPVHADYFGTSKHKTGAMVEWLQENAEKIGAEDWSAIAAALSAQAQLKSQAAADKADAEKIARGVKLIEKHCTECHRLGDVGDLGTAPDFTGYGSYDWMMGFVSKPTHERFYRDENDGMPSFADDLNAPATHKVSVRELSLIVDWLRGEYYRAGDKEPIMPHDEETARRVVVESRMMSVPKREIIGAAKNVKPSPSEEK